MKSLRVIKEPIHDYIAISDLESAILNDPLFQRLHHVTQNGTAYLTYPSNRTSRFVHSLGVMHLGGRMFTAALFASEAVVREQLATGFLKIIEKASSDVSCRLDQVEAYLNQTEDICYRHNGYGTETKERVAETVMFQSVRIACVLHDVGHPPFSHTTEHVLTSQLQSSVPKASRSAPYTDFLRSLSGLGQQKLHENVGTALIGYIFSSISEEGDRRRFGQLCFWIANRIANEGLTADTSDGIFSCLHKIVSSSGFDSDRGDYVLRDGYASSFEFGEYDLTRVLDNLRFVLTAGHFELVATTAATSALESYFLERYRVWRWLVFHHSVVRGEVALSRALTILLEIFFDTGSTDMHESAIRAILESSKFNRLWSPFASPDTYPEYVACDEPWLLSLLRQLQERLGTSPLPRKLAMLRIYLDFLLDRRKTTFFTLWKRAEEYEEFATSVHETFQRSVSKATKKPSQLNMIRKADKESNTQWFNRVIMNWISKSSVTGEIESMRKYESSIQAALKKRKVDLSGSLLLKPLSFSTKIDSKLIDKAGRLLSLEELSSVVADLPSAWNKDMQLRAYWVSLEPSGSEFTSGESREVPSRKELGKVFLPALLGGTTLTHLKSLAQ